LRSSRCPPPSQYRFLSSRTTLRSTPLEDATALHRQPLLPSTTPASAVRLSSSPQNASRPFHISARARQKETTAEKEAKTSQEEKSDEEAKSKEGEEEAENKKQRQKKDDLPPPPPHGDKTPWQVFMETMQKELKESKEWNESTKAIAASANEFVESESVRKARQAYEATSGAVSSTAAKAVKTTADVIGKGAAWTWETPVMKGVRKGAVKTTEVLDKATKPIRETEAYKEVKEVIDDGSSSRYGGWIDKEERRKRREKWLKEFQQNGMNQAVYEENPK
jgi:import inner membrane translocase subunit TIM44